MSSIEGYQEFCKLFENEKDHVFEETGGIITLRLAAKVLNKSKETIRRYCASGELKAIRDTQGICWGIMPFDLYHFVDKKGWI